MMKKKISIVLWTGLIVLLFGVAAGAAVRAEWEQSRKKKIAFTMEVSKAVPSLVIVRLRLPAGLAIVGIAPSPKKRDDTKHGLKLLFTNLHSGSNRIVLTTDRSIGKQSITGTIMYKDPATGNKEEVEIH